MLKVRNEKGVHLVKNMRLKEITLDWIVRMFPDVDHVEINMFGDPVVVAYKDGGAVGYVDCYNVKKIK